MDFPKNIIRGEWMGGTSNTREGDVEGAQYFIQTSVVV
jgi:hypothetical protein